MLILVLKDVVRKNGSLLYIGDEKSYSPYPLVGALDL